ncbi:hypothetical protein ACWDA7_30450 [Streptomyces sp. NPDC001156]
MPRIRKERAGSDSFGNHWPEDGSVVEVEPEHVGPLLAIADGGFSEVTPAAEEPDDDGDGDGQGDGDGGDGDGGEGDGDGDGDEGKNPEFSEVNPQAPTAERKTEDAGDRPKPPAKKAAARKTAARKPAGE